MTNDNVLVSLHDWNERNLRKGNGIACPTCGAELHDGVHNSMQDFGQQYPRVDGLIAVTCLECWYHGHRNMTDTERAWRNALR